MLNQYSSQSLDQNLSYQHLMYIQSYQEFHSNNYNNCKQTNNNKNTLIKRTPAYLSVLI